MYGFLKLVAVTVALALPVAAQQTPGTPLSPDVEHRLDQVEIHYHLQARKNPGVLIEQLLQGLFRNAPDGILTRVLLESRFEQVLATQRAAQMSRYLRYDLDGDGTLSAAELLKSDGVDNIRDRAVLLRLRYESDADGDGRLSHAELLAAAEAAVSRLRDRGPGDLHLLSFDMNGDGAVTASEIIAAVDALSRKPLPGASPQAADRPQAQPGTAQDAEERRLARLSERVEAKRLTIRDAGLPELCAYPAKSGTAEVHWIEATRGQALSTVAVDGTLEQTTVAELHIASGDTPFYLVLGGRESMIWKLSGDADRVERVVTRPGHGIVGVTADKVHFAKSGVCAPGPSDLGKSLAQEVLKSALFVAFGGAEIKGYASERIGSVVFPGMRDVIDAARLDRVKEPIYRNGEVYELVDGGLRRMAPEAAARRALEHRFESSFPRGVVEIDPADVVAAGPVERYDLLPAEAGLLQMMDRGALRGEGLDRLIITRAVPAMPAGLKMANNHSQGRRFFVEPGVTLDGDSGNLHGFLFLDAEDNGCVDGIPCGIRPAIK